MSGDRSASSREKATLPQLPAFRRAAELLHQRLETDICANARPGAAERLWRLWRHLFCCVNSPKGYRRTDGPIYTAYARFYWAQPLVGSDGPVRMEGHRSTRGWTSFFAAEPLLLRFGSWRSPCCFALAVGKKSILQKAPLGADGK